MIKEVYQEVLDIIKDINKIKIMEKTFELPKEFAEKWLTTLRSEDYIQTEGTLFRPDCENMDEYLEDPSIGGGYCCLGIAAKVCGISDSEMLYDDLLEDRSDFFIKNGVPEELTRENIGYIEYLLPGILSTLNDGLTESNYKAIITNHPDLVFRKEINFDEDAFIKFNFNEIADFIQDNVKFI